MLSHKTLDYLPSRLLEYAWLATIFLLPLIFWPGVYTSFELPKAVLFRTMTSVMVLLWTWKVLASGRVSLLRTGHNGAGGRSTMRLMFVLLGFTVFSWFISSLMSFAPAVSFMGAYPRFQGLFTLVQGVLFAVIVFSNLEHESQIENIMTAVIGSGLASSIFALLGQAGVVRLNFWDVDAFLGRAFGTMGHPDFFAAFLMLVLVAAAGKILRFQKKDVRFVLSLVTFPIAFIALLLTSSRSAMLGTVVGIVVLFAVTFWKRRLKCPFRATLLVPLMALLLVVAANVWKPLGSLPFVDRLVFTGENLRSIETRMELWPATVRLILERPFFGWGPDTFALTFPHVAPARLNILENLQSYSDRAHNFVLDYTQQFGVVGLTLFIAFLTLVFFTSWRAISRDNSHRWKVILPLFTAEIALLTALLFGFFVTTLWMLFWLLGAVMLWLCWMPEKVPVELPGFLRPSTIIGSTLIALLLAVITIVLYFLSVELFSADAAYLGSFTGDIAGLTSSYESVAENPIEPVYVLHTVDLLREKALAENTPDDRNLIFAIANRLADHALLLTNRGGNALVAKAQLKLAQSADDASLADESYQLFDEAVASMPNSPDVHLDYGKALLQGGKKQAALHQFNIYLGLCPQYWQWKDSLPQHSSEEQNRYRVFYKLNPDFDEVFGLMEQARL